MSEKTNREKMLDEEEYFPDKELADLAYECSCGGKANPVVETLQVQGTGRHSQGDRHAGQPE